ncbi:trichohyalin-like isoform X2 [Palaemon carinicauda]|uniref:trichohyalin-like isoform X2 n=1 Tax=Palaemon carinicauda TaxID=392227 RepID=UPI0035B5FBB5
MSAANLASYVYNKLSGSGALIPGSSDMNSLSRSTSPNPKLTAVWRTKPPKSEDIPSSSPTFKEDGSLLRLLRTKSMPSLMLEKGSPIKQTTPVVQPFSPTAKIDTSASLDQSTSSSLASPITSRHLNPRRNLEDSDFLESSTNTSIATPPSSPKEFTTSYKKLTRSVSDGQIIRRRRQQLRGKSHDFPPGGMPSVKTLRLRFDTGQQIDSQDSSRFTSNLGSFSSINKTAQRSYNKMENGNEVSVKTTPSKDEREKPEAPTENKKLFQHESFSRFEPQRKEVETQSEVIDVSQKSVKSLLKKFERTLQSSNDDEIFHISQRQSRPLKRTVQAKQFSEHHSSLTLDQEDEQETKTINGDPEQVLLRQRSKSLPVSSKRSSIANIPANVQKLKMQFEKQSGPVEEVPPLKVKTREKEEFIQNPKEANVYTFWNTEQRGGGSELKKQASLDKVLETKDQDGEYQTPHVNTPDIKPSIKETMNQESEKHIPKSPKVQTLRKHFESPTSPQLTRKTDKKERPVRRRHTIALTVKEFENEAKTSNKESLQPTHLKDADMANDLRSQSSVKSLLRQFELQPPKDKASQLVSSKTQDVSETEMIKEEPLLPTHVAIKPLVREESLIKTNASELLTELKDEDSDEEFYDESGISLKLRAKGSLDYGERGLPTGKTRRGFLQRDYTRVESSSDEYSSDHEQISTRIEIGDWRAKKLPEHIDNERRDRELTDIEKRNQEHAERETTQIQKVEHFTSQRDTERMEKEKIRKMREKEEERMAREKADYERRQRDKIEQKERERAEQERKEKERAEQERREKEKAAQERKEHERLEKIERERKELEQRERERERLERDREEKEEFERKEKERKEKEEQERRETEKEREKQKIDKEKQRRELERQEKEKAELEREKHERIEKKRAEVERKERETSDQEKMKKIEEENIIWELAERERLERENIEFEVQEQKRPEQEEKERSVKEQAERERYQERIAKEKTERERKKVEEEEKQRAIQMERDKEMAEKARLQRERETEELTKKHKVGKLVDKFTTLQGTEGDIKIRKDSIKSEETEQADFKVGELIEKFVNRKEEKIENENIEELQEKKPAPIPSVSTKNVPGKVRNLNPDELRFFNQGGASLEPFVRSQSLRIKKNEPPLFQRGGSLRVKSQEPHPAPGSVKNMPKSCRQLRPDELRFFAMTNNNIYLSKKSANKPYQPQQDFRLRSQDDQRKRPTGSPGDDQGHEENTDSGSDSDTSLLRDYDHEDESTDEALMYSEHLDLSVTPYHEDDEDDDEALYSSLTTMDSVIKGDFTQDSSMNFNLSKISSTSRQSMDKIKHLDSFSNCLYEDNDHGNNAMMSDALNDNTGESVNFEMEFSPENPCILTHEPKTSTPLSSITNTVRTDYGYTNEITKEDSMSDEDNTDDDIGLLDDAMLDMKDDQHHQKPLLDGFHQDIQLDVNRSNITSSIPNPELPESLRNVLESIGARASPIDDQALYSTTEGAVDGNYSRESSTEENYEGTETKPIEDYFLYIDESKEYLSDKEFGVFCLMVALLSVIIYFIYDFFL